MKIFVKIKNISRGSLNVSDSPLDSQWQVRWHSAWTCFLPGCLSHCCRTTRSAWIWKRDNMLNIITYKQKLNQNHSICHTSSPSVCPTAGSRSTAGLHVDRWTRTCACTAWADGWSWGGEPWEGHQPPDSLQTTGEHNFVNKTSFSSVCTSWWHKGDDHTHTAEHFGRTTSATAGVHTGPTLRAPRDSVASRREIGTPPLPQTELSGTTPGSTGGASGSQRNGTLLLDRRQERVSWNTWERKILPLSKDVELFLCYLKPACCYRTREISPLMSDVFAYILLCTVICDSEVFPCSFTFKSKHLFCPFEYRTNWNNCYTWNFHTRCDKDKAKSLISHRGEWKAW